MFYLAFYALYVHWNGPSKHNCTDLDPPVCHHCCVPSVADLLISSQPGDCITVCAQTVFIFHCTILDDIDIGRPTPNCSGHKASCDSCLDKAF
jgi:hypothetical protein